MNAKVKTERRLPARYSRKGLAVLRAYLVSLDRESQAAFCARCGTKLRYVKKVIWLAGKKRFGRAICIAFERESNGAVTCEALRPDIDWNYLRRVSVVPSDGTRLDLNPESVGS